jgi:catechol 2,3-dioxygenase-like lactoylglutathione lyase family enzyme
MNAATFARIAATLFGLVALAHAARLVFAMPVSIGNGSVPMAASWGGVVLFAALSAWGWRSGSRHGGAVPVSPGEKEHRRHGGSHGLSHLSLAVRDLDRTLAFYVEAFGVREYFRDDTQVQVLGPGPHDVLAFERDPDNAGRTGGIGHFGFRLAAPDDMDAAVAAVLAAGGTLLRRGEFAPGLPFAYIADPDGYEIELWFE